MAIAEYPDTRVPADERQMIDVLNPATQEVIGQIPVTTAEEVEDAVERARFAQKTWGALTVKERTRFIQRWIDLLWDEHSEAIRILRQENGKSDGSAYLEVLAIDGVAQYYVHQAARILKPERRRTLFPGVQWAKVYHKPHGVVGLITPWNYPFAIPFFDMIPALIAGNTVVFKPSEVTPFIAEFGVELMYEAGVPRDVLQIVHGDGSTGAALVDNVDFVQFTGSTPVGKIIGKRCVDRLVPFSLELGGNDPAIVLADANPDMAAIGLIQGAFENKGQMCISIERVYVEEAIYDKLLERLIHYAQQITMRGGEGMDVVVGSMTKEAELQRAQEHIADAVAKGAKVAFGGEPRPDLGPLFFEPTILVDVDHSMDVMQEETFGPLMSVMKVKDAQEAVRLANATRYGLSASIFTKNLKRANKLAQQIDSGDVSVNRAQFVMGTPALPSGGQRESGLGRRNGKEGLLKYTASQSVLLDNMLGAEKSLAIATPRIINIVKVLHHVRRRLPFV